MLLGIEIRRSVALAATSFLVVGLVLAAISPARSQAPGAPAQVVDYEPPIRNESYRVTDFGKSASARDDRLRNAKFRVAERTGNCCENYLTTAPDGTLYDLGGRYISFTEDNGKTWKQVQTLEPLANGEGAISIAPGGDIVGIEWDPYSGDHLLAYKYDAAAEQWQYLESPLHTPFYDRPWLTVVPGPFVINGAEVPYVTFVDAYPHSGPLLYSTDGLTYVQVSAPTADHQLEPAVEGWVKTTADRDFDWVLPNSQSPITAIGNGSALAAPGAFDSSWSVFNPETQRWAELTLPDGDLDGRLQVDSRGRIHNLLMQGQLFTYRISSDGGRSWKSTVVELPEGNSSAGALMTDFRVNAEIGIAAIGIHATGEQSDRDLLYKLDISGKAPRVTSLYEIGLGDINASSGVGQEIRLDFQTVAIFPDGRLAVSFLDSTTGPIYSFTELVSDRLGPAVAIEL